MPVVAGEDNKLSSWATTSKMPKVLTADVLNPRRSPSDLSVWNRSGFSADVGERYSGWRRQRRRQLDGAAATTVSHHLLALVFGRRSSLR